MLMYTHNATKQYSICAECKGNGYVKIDTPLPRSVDNTVVCSVCQGSGHVGDIR